MKIQKNLVQSYEIPKIFMSEIQIIIVNFLELFMDVSALNTDHRTACSLHTEDPKTRLQPLFEWAACDSLDHCTC